ncbi:TPA: fimbrial protein [Enterobacter soli]|nr:fimbrial protein [Enterobacter soli]
MIYRRIIAFILSFIVLMLFSSQIAFASCGITLGSVKQSNKSLNLSTAFASSSTYTVSYTTNWSGSMTCTTGILDTVYFFDAFGGNPVYMNFSSTDGSTDYWIKVTNEITGNTKQSVSGITGIHGMSNYQTQYTLTFELLNSAPSGVADYTKTTTGSSINLYPAILSDGDSSSKYDCVLVWSCSTYAQNVWDYMMNDTAKWSTARYMAYEKLSVQFEPEQTTCNLTKDITIKLPPTTIDVLNASGEAPGTSFRLPVSCRDALGDSMSTRNITAWFSSNDILNSADTGTILVNEDSEAGGVGVSVRSTTSGSDLIFSSGTSNSGATAILNIAENDSVESAFNINLYAYYKVYNASALTTGSVTATAQIMFGYD